MIERYFCSKIMKIFQYFIILYQTSNFYLEFSSSFIHACIFKQFLKRKNSINTNSIDFNTFNSRERNDLSPLFSNYRMANRGKFDRSAHDSRQINSVNETKLEPINLHFQRSLDAWPKVRVTNNSERNLLSN